MGSETKTKSSIDDNELEDFLLAHNAQLEAKLSSYRTLMNLRRADLVRKELTNRCGEFLAKNDTLETDPAQDLKAYYKELLPEFEGSHEEQLLKSIKVPYSKLASCFQSKTISIQKVFVKTHKELLKDQKCEVYAQLCKELGDELFRKSLLTEFRKYRAGHLHIDTNQVKQFLERNLSDLTTMTDNFT